MRYLFTFNVFYSHMITRWLNDHVKIAFIIATPDCPIEFIPFIWTLVNMTLMAACMNFRCLTSRLIPWQTHFVILLLLFVIYISFIPKVSLVYKHAVPNWWNDNLRVGEMSIIILFYFYYFGNVTLDSNKL